MLKLSTNILAFRDFSILYRNLRFKFSPHSHRGHLSQEKFIWVTMEEENTSFLNNHSWWLMKYSIGSFCSMLSRRQGVNGEENWRWSEIHYQYRRTREYLWVNLGMSLWVLMVTVFLFNDQTSRQWAVKSFWALSREVHKVNEASLTIFCHLQCYKKWQNMIIKCGFVLIFALGNYILCHLSSQGNFILFLNICTLSHRIYLGILALWIDLGEMNEI